MSGGGDDVDDDGSESTSEEELYVNRHDEYDYNSPVPIHFQRREKYIKSEPELDEVKKKIAELKLKGFKGISFTARNASDAYECLHILSDSNGCKINYVRQEESNDPGWDIEYLRLLKKYGECVKKVQASRPFGDSRVVKLQRESSIMCGEDLALSFQDYYDIYWYGELVEQWRGIQEILLDPKTKEEYLSGAQTFEQKLQELKTSYRLVREEYLRAVFESPQVIKFTRRSQTLIQAVVRWWTGGSEEKGRESAISLIDDRIKKAIKVRDNRFEEWFLKADYVKLKVDVARAVGIIKEIPDELADFALPGNFKWLSSERIFVRTPYEPYEQSEQRTIKM